MSLENTLDRMFAVHNRKPMNLQYDEYMNIFKIIGDEAAEKVFVHVRDEEDRFPTIKQLWAIIHSLGVYKNEVREVVYEDCYYCCSTGYIPYLISPKRDKSVVSYNTQVYACKCRAGIDLPKYVPRYFEKFNQVQFEPIKDYPYPIVVSINQKKYNEQYRMEAKNDSIKRPGGASTQTMGANELREGIKKVTEHYAVSENGA